MLRRSPLRAKRATPRRNLGRVQHGKTKDGGARPPTKEERRHMDRVASQGCAVTGRPDAVLHHVMHMDGKARRRDHRFVVALVPELHNMGAKSVHSLGGERAFLEEHGVDLVEIAKREWDRSRGMA